MSELARNNDPITSHLAPGSKTSRDTIRAAVLRVLSTFTEGITDEDLVEAYELHPLTPLATPQGIRSRRAELVRDGLVVAVEGRFGVTQTGRKATLWEVAGD